MKYEENMSGWRKALKDNDLNFSPDIDELKLTSIKRLLNSGLPTYDFYFLNIDEVTKGTIAQKIYNEFDNSVVVRVCPKIKGLQRYTFINKSLEYVKKNLKKIKDKEKYTISFNEYDPALYAGVINSNKKSLIIELVEDNNLERLCHSHTTPYSASFHKDEHGNRRMTYQTNIPLKLKETMWQIVKSISELNNQSNIPEFIPKTGYFEFVISKKYKGVRFIDYVPLK